MNKDIKFCPYRESKNIGNYLTKEGTWTTINFMPCLEDDCMAYDEKTGKCKRLK